MSLKIFMMWVMTDDDDVNGQSKCSQADELSFISLVCNDRLLKS